MFSDTMEYTPCFEEVDLNIIRLFSGGTLLYLYLWHLMSKFNSSVIKLGNHIGVHALVMIAANLVF